ncbi:hypothetical protein PspLS_12172 [Pyricularia sp. CBS 133598]|nr:hypothetical protein PspLS_12172 [Pyricularia sp. CBS 133598]
MDKPNQTDHKTREAGDVPRAQKLEEVSEKATQSDAVLISAFAGFIQQYATLRDPKTGSPALDANHISLWGALYFVTAIAIQFIAPHTADRFGRKFNMWGLTFFLTLSIVIAVISTNWVVLLVSRLVAGCAGGLIGTSVMVYMSEVALPQFRGALLASFSLAFSLGQVFLAVALKTLQDTTPLRFRNIFYSEFVFFGLWILPMLYLPESPVWLATKGRHDEAKRSLRKLVGGKVDGYDIEHEYAVLKQEVEQSIQLSETHGGESDWKAMVAPLNLKRALISTLPFTYQNIVGVPLMFGYTTYFFSLANVSDPFLGKLIINIVLLLGIVTSFYFVDTVGRRTLVLGGGFGMGWISLVEISSPKLRAKTASLAVMVQYLTGILFNYTTPLMLSAQYAGWGQKIGLFFGGLTLLYLIPCVLLFPETKGRSYHELDELFELGVPAWKFAKTKTTQQIEREDARGD